MAKIKVLYKRTLSIKILILDAPKGPTKGGAT